MQVDASVAGDGLGECHLVGGLDELVGEMGGQGVLDPVAGHGGLCAERDEQVRFAGAGVADQTQRLPLLDPFALGEGVDHGGVDVGVGVEVEGPQGLLPGELGGLDPTLGPASCTVVTLGEQ